MHKIIPFLVLLFLGNVSFAQDFSQNISIEQILSKNTPFWMKANNFGKYDSENSALLFESNSVYKYNFNNGINLTSNATLVLRGARHSTFYFPKLSVSFSYKKLAMQMGRFYHRKQDTRLENLSTGTITMSKNAVPIPRVLIKSDYVTVPYTKSFFQIKGNIAHGVVDGNRAVNRPYLHESNITTKFGNSRLNLSIGLQRYAFWGGKSSDLSIGELPSSFNDFIKVLFSRKGGKDAPSIDQDYRLGDQFGNYISELTYQNDKFILKGYWQNFFEDKDGLILKNYKDGLFGLFVTSKRKTLISSLLFEHLYSKDQSGPNAPDGTRGGPGGQDNYYNHSVYLTGWSYFGRSVGTPFFTHDDDIATLTYFFDNNRVAVNHLGIGGYLNDSFNYFIKLSRSNNHGNYRFKEYAENSSIPYNFKPAKKQYSSLVGLSYTTSNYKWLAKLALDVGDLYPNRVGLLIGYSIDIQ